MMIDWRMVIIIFIVVYVALNAFYIISYTLKGKKLKEQRRSLLARTTALKEQSRRFGQK